MHFRKWRCILSAKSTPVKTSQIRLCFTFLAFFILATKSSFAQPQGKVVVNEYMSWTSGGCGTTAEFVELLNFGPGPVDIGCYILTTGVYSVTIPPNTIIKPGEYYILAGKDFLPGSCANVDSSATGVIADLNWNTCNCTNVPIPTTGDGMMKDGGSSNTPLVLLDPALNIVDAIVRNTPTEPVGPVTSSGLSGACAPKSFNIGTMNPSYEALGMAAGRGNSFARTLDGDCNWQKTPQQSANATNNKPGNTTDISYDFDMIKPTSCTESGTGSVSIYVKHSDYAIIFPMTYAIATDVDNDGDFDFNDQYETFTDNEAPFVEIDNLPVGHFKVTVASVKGCYLKNFEFTVIPCEPNTLPVKLVYFKNAGSKDNRHQLEWLLQDVQNLQSIVLQKATEDGRFITSEIISNAQRSGAQVFTTTVDALSKAQFYRLKIVQKSGRPFYSPVISTSVPQNNNSIRIWPNPATTQLHITLNNPAKHRLTYHIYNNSGLTVGKGILPGNQGENTATIPVQALPPGVYQLQLTDPSGVQQPIPFRFVKH